VKCVGRIPTVGTRVGQRAEDVQELEYRSRPSVREYQRKRAGFGRAGVDEVDAQAVHRVTKLRKGVESLGESKVVVLGPATAELLGVGQRHAL